jgi:acetaldehyde dehydrogenase
VEGAAHYLPAYAGNLDIMTSAALATAERIAGARSVAHAVAA